MFIISDKNVGCGFILNNLVIRMRFSGDAALLYIGILFIES